MLTTYKVIMLTTYKVTSMVLVHNKSKSLDSGIEFCPNIQKEVLTT